MLNGVRNPVHLIKGQRQREGAAAGVIGLLMLLGGEESKLYSWGANRTTRLSPRLKASTFFFLLQASTYFTNRYSAITNKVLKAYKYLLTL